jgi:hypothetical protein
LAKRLAATPPASSFAGGQPGVIRPEAPGDPALAGTGDAGTGAVLATALGGGAGGGASWHAATRSAAPAIEMIRMGDLRAA